MMSILIETILLLGLEFFEVPKVQNAMLFQQFNHGDYIRQLRNEFFAVGCPVWIGWSVGLKPMAKCLTTLLNNLATLFERRPQQFDFFCSQLIKQFQSPLKTPAGPGF